MTSPDVITFGCRLNAFESEAIRARATEAGLTDAVIINTCAVTAEAVRQSRQSIRRIRRENPHAKIIVTGCAAQIEPDTFAAMDEVDLVIGNSEKLERATYDSFGIARDERVRVNDIMSVRETAWPFVDSFTARARAVLQVQNGCDHRCTFCIIPFGRGNSRSVPMGAVIDAARKLMEAGYREIVLTGVDLTAYGSDLPGTPTLSQLVRKILRGVPELKRLRLSSIDTIELDPEFLGIVAEEPRLMPHFHISAQSGDNLILKRMKRRHLREHTIRFCEEIRRLRPDAAFGADLIAGFPTENDEMFANSCALIDEAGISYLHVFPFSARAGTPASRMPQLPREIVKERARLLREKGTRALSARLDSFVGKRVEVLVENRALGYTPCFAQVRLAGQQQPGTMMTVRIARTQSRQLVAASA